MIRVLIADDHGPARAGLSRLLSGAGDIEVAGAAATGREAVELGARTRADVALMDLSMPGLDGVGATRELGRVAPGTRVVMLTSYPDRRHILDATDAGAV